MGPEPEKMEVGPDIRAEKLAEARSRIIVALDVPDIISATNLVKELYPHVGAFKIGFEFITALVVDVLRGPSDGWLDRMVSARSLFEEIGDKLFWDNKFHDIPNTVASAIHALKPANPKMFNVHATGGQTMMESAAREKGDSIALAVTLLTSLSQQDIDQIGIRGDSKDVVQDLAAMAMEAGLDGVVCSTEEVQRLRMCMPNNFLLVTPGIRPTWSSKNDQSRVGTPAAAIINGANYLVVGRAITSPPEEIGSPVDATQLIAEEIAVVL